MSARIPSDFVTLEAVRFVLRDYREERHFTQRAIAARTGFNEKTLSSWENGSRTQGIRIGDLLTLLATYDVTLAQFEADVQIRLDEFAKFRREIA